VTCREFVDFLLDYDAGEISAPQRTAFDAHMAECPPCVVYLETYRETVVLGKAAFEASDEALPDEVPERLVEAILAARRQPR
jgi:anti-sigma factor RsiW